MLERLGIAGTGVIACGLAKVAEPHGSVVVWARSAASADRAGEALAGTSAIVTTELDSFTDRTFVVEAIAEDREAKGALLADLHGRLDADTVLATTTSTLSVGDLARASGRPARFAAFHVFNPVTKMSLVELAFPTEADERTRARAHELCEALGKRAIEVPDAPGFVVNRLLFPFLFDAVRLLERHNLGPAEVDECLKLGAGHPMGPLALLDLVGLDVCAAIGEGLGIEVPERVRALAAEGALGRKSGRGFHAY